MKRFSFFISLVLMVALSSLSSAGVIMRGSGGGGGLSAPSWFGEAGLPADEGTLYVSSCPCNIPYPSSMQSGDLIIIVGYLQDNDNDYVVVVNDGGQTWNALGTTIDTNTFTSKAYWATFNGTWSSTPTWDSSTTSDTNATGMVAYVFRPGSGSYTWALDVTEDDSTFAAPGSPYNVTISGVTTNTEQAVVLADWISIGGVVNWTLQTGGWTQTAEYDQYGGGDMTVNSAYMIKATAGSTGDVTNQENTPVKGFRRINAWKQVAP